MCTSCRVQDDPKGFWAFHRPFSAPRVGSGMCVFLLFGEEIAFAHDGIYFFGEGGAKGKEMTLNVFQRRDLI